MRSMLRENMALTPTARTLWEIQERAGRLPVETATNLYTEALRRLDTAIEKSDARRALVKDAESLARYQAETRELFLKCLGGLPKTPATLVTRTTGCENFGAYTLEKVLLQPREGTWATCNVYVPAAKPGPFPAVLMTVGHDDRGKADPE